MKLSKEAQELLREYMREWRKKNKEKTREYLYRYWEKKAKMKKEEENKWGDIWIQMKKGFSFQNPSSYTSQFLLYTRF